MKQIDADKISEMEDQSRQVRAMSLAERGRLLEAACRAATEIEHSRLANGLPPSQPVPWPESTWEFLKKMRPSDNSGEKSIDAVTVAKRIAAELDRRGCANIWWEFTARDPRVAQRDELDREISH